MNHTLLCRAARVGALLSLTTTAACGDYLQRTWDKASADEDAKEAHDAQVLTADLTIDNHWAEAAFTVSRTDGGDLVPQTRVPGDSSITYAGLLQGHPDLPLQLTVNTVAAQTYRRFDLSEQVQAGRTLHLVFDYDTVTLLFRLVPQWQDN